MSTHQAAANDVWTTVRPYTSEQRTCHSLSWQGPHLAVAVGQRLSTCGAVSGDLARGWVQLLHHAVRITAVRLSLHAQVSSSSGASRASAASAMLAGSTLNDAFQPGCTHCYT
jgi:hypothetical protein